MNIDLLWDFLKLVKEDQYYKKLQTKTFDSIKIKILNHNILHWQNDGVPAKKQTNWCENLVLLWKSNSESKS